MSLWKSFEVFRIEEDEKGLIRRDITKDIIAESNVNIIVDGKKMVSSTCLEGFSLELAIGYLFNEGFIYSMEDVKSYNLSENSLGSGVKVEIDLVETEDVKELDHYFAGDKLKLKASEIFDSMRGFMKKSPLFRDIGGAHSVMLVIYDDLGNVSDELFVEDIGRHNCYDKIAGRLLLAGSSNLTEKSAIFTSGRLSTEIMSKIVRMKVPFVVSRSTPTAEAVEMAINHNITVMGFVRGNEGVLYSSCERVIV